MNSIDKAADLLEASDDFRVLRRFHPVERYAATIPPSNADIKTGLVIDTETEGLNPNSCKMIEIGLVAFEFDANTGIIYDVLDHFSMFEAPGRPLEPIITQITGIVDKDLEGCTFDDSQVNIWLDSADIIICHNAKFDAAFLANRFPSVKGKRFACSFSEIDWKNEGISHSSQEFIAMMFGFFYSAHRAEDDALALLHILSHSLPFSNEKALKVLFDNSSKDSVKVWAVGAPFDKKDDLKERRYRWESETPYGRCWTIEISEELLKGEMEYLESSIYSGLSQSARPRITKINATNRFLRAA